MALHTVTCYRNSTRCKVCGEKLLKSMKAEHLSQWRSIERIMECIQNDNDKELTMALNHGVKLDYRVDRQEKCYCIFALNMMRKNVFSC